VVGVGVLMLCSFDVKSHKHLPLCRRQEEHESSSSGSVSRPSLFSQGESV